MNQTSALPPANCSAGVLVGEVYLPAPISSLVDFANKLETEWGVDNVLAEHTQDSIKFFIINQNRPRLKPNTKLRDAAQTQPPTPSTHE